MTVKYGVFPGEGDNYVPAEKLMELYGVDPDECVVITSENLEEVALDDLVHLHPHMDGPYQLP